MHTGIVNTIVNVMNNHVDPAKRCSGQRRMTPDPAIEVLSRDHSSREYRIFQSSLSLTRCYPAVEDTGVGQTPK